MAKLSWSAIAWGLLFMIGIVIVLMLVEGMLLELSDYTLRAPGRFLSYEEYVAQEYGFGILLVYFLFDLIETAVPCYIAACAATARPIAHAVGVILVATLFSWIVFRWIFYSPIHELIGLGAALLVALATGALCRRRRARGAKPF